MMQRPKGASLFLISALTAATLGCGAVHYKQSADKEAYSVIEEKSEGILGMPTEFTIDRAFEIDSAASEFPADATTVVALVDAIEIAVEHSREYQTQREALFIQALSLTDSRREFDVIPFGTASGTLAGSDDVDDSIVGAFSAGVSKMLATGADLSVSIATNLFRYLSGDPAETASSVITASIIQPLLRDAGRDVTLENLTQAERDMTYAVRDFVRFRRSFSVRIAKSYYALLERADQVQNAYNNYESLQFVRRRAEVMAAAGRLPELQVDQAKQDEYRARDSWVRSLEGYLSALDEFKLTLGIPIDASIAPDPKDLQDLQREGIDPIRLTPQEAVEAALSERLDLRTVRDLLEDRHRKVIVAENDLRADLDLSLRYSRDTEEDAKTFDFIDGGDVYSVGLDLDLPFDRKSERNAYRRALIFVEQAQRNLDETVDVVKQDVRNAFRQLEQAEESYQIQIMSLDLAKRRAESTKLLQKAGRAITRDVLEAEEDLLNAQNAVTSALIDRNNSRLDLYLAMEALIIDDRGLWFEKEGNDEAFVAPQP